MQYKKIVLPFLVLVMLILAGFWPTSSINALENNQAKLSDVANGASVTSQNSPPVSAPTQVASLSSLTYIVKPGDTLSYIAWQYDLTLQELMMVNNIVDPDLIHVGQVLVIPTKSSLATCPLVHVVQAGETLGTIAQDYGVPLQDLVTLNHIRFPDLIYIGTVLVIPVQSTCDIGSDSSSQILDGPKRIVVDLSEQRTYLYQGDSLVHGFVVSTGQPGQETPIGTYLVENKLPVAQAYTWNLQMPAWVGWDYWAGSPETGYLQNGFHALPIQADGTRLWDGYLGTPVSFGCVILSQQDADALYEWADIGTPIEVQP